MNLLNHQWINKKNGLRVAAIAILAFIGVQVVSSTTAKAIRKKEMAATSVALAALSQSERESLASGFHTPNDTRMGVVYDWYKEKGLIANPDIALGGLYFDNGAWKLMRVKEAPEDWLRLLTRGHANEGQKKEITVRLREGRYELLDYLDSLGWVYLTDGAKREAMETDGGNALGMTGDTIYTRRDVENLQKASSDIAKDAAFAITSEDVKAIEAGEASQSWMPQKGGCSFDLMKLSARTKSKKLVDLALAVKAFPEGSSVRKDIVASLGLTTEELGEGILKPTSYKWKSSRMPGYLDLWAADIGKPGDPWADIAEIKAVPHTEESPDTDGREIGDADDIGYCRWFSEKSRYTAKTRHTYDETLDRLEFPNAPSRNQSIEVTSGYFNGKIVIRYKRITGRGAKEIIMVSQGKSWRVGDGDMYSSSGSIWNGGKIVTSITPWDWSNGVFEIGNAKIESFGVRPDVFNSETWQVPAPFIEKLKLLIARLGYGF